ncbi:YbjN domain-containing protein [Chlorobium limicola]|nr:YbjN domain-containing protein [Chlorobium limicola]
MSLLTLFGKMLREYFPDGSIETLEQNGDYRLSANLIIDDRVYWLSIESHEITEWLLVYLYPPFMVPAAKYAEASTLFNTINDRYSYPGRLTVSDDGGICYKQILDMEGIEPSMRMLRNMVDSARKLFENHAEAIRRVSSDYRRGAKIVCLC